MLFPVSQGKYECASIFLYPILNTQGAVTDIEYDKEIEMGYLLGWLLGVPIGILLLIWLLSHIF